MRVTKTESRTVKTYTLTIEDGEVRPQPYSRAERQYRVDRVVVTKTDGNVSDVRLWGQVLRKDGSDSLNRCDESLRWGVKPAWVEQLIKGLA